MAPTSAPERVTRPLSDDRADEYLASTSEIERRLEAHLLIARRLPKQRPAANGS